MKPILYLIPSPLGEEPVDHILPPYNQRIILTLRHFIVEEIKTARRYLRRIDRTFPIDDCEFLIFNEHSHAEDVSALLVPLRKGFNMGLLSEAGLPCVADPGSALVREAQLEGYVVKPLSGPSSIFMALMASGFNGQQFTFHGYLPVDKRERESRLKSLERDSVQTHYTQIFIETPYRNNALLDSILATCNPGIYLCIASQVQQEGEFIVTKTIADWKKKRPDLNKKPAVFLLSAG